MSARGQKLPHSDPSRRLCCRTCTKCLSQLPPAFPSFCNTSNTSCKLKPSTFLSSAVTLKTPSSPVPGFCSLDLMIYAIPAGRSRKTRYAFCWPACYQLARVMLPESHACCNTANDAVKPLKRFASSLGSHISSSRRNNMCSGGCSAAPSFSQPSLLDRKPHGMIG